MRAGQWLAFVAAVLVIVGLAGFGFYRIRHGAPAPTTTPKLVASAEVDPFSSLRQLLKGVQLPQAAHGALHGGQPNVIVTQEAIYLENERLADLSETTKQDRIQRVDQLFNALKARREQWKTAHPGQELAGELVLWVDQRVGVLAIKSIFQTAAFAGYPNEGFVARCNCPQELTVVRFGALVPGPPREAHEPRPTLGVLVRSAEQAELVWAAEGIPAAPRTVKLAELPAAVEQLWAQGNAARGATSALTQEAVLYVDDTQTLGSLVKVLEALSLPRYTTSAKGERQEYPSFSSILKVSKVPEDALDLAKVLLHGPSVSGRLAPDVIQAVVREHFPDYRRCYDQLLAKEPNARGRVPMAFTISRTGEVSAASVAEGSRVSELDDEVHPQPKGPRLSDPQLERCMISAFKKLKFPPPEGGVVNVAYPLMLAPE